MLQDMIHTKNNKTLGDCTCLYKFEKDTILESLQGNLNTIDELLTKEKAKRKADVEFIRYLSEKYTSIENLKQKVYRSVICGI